MQLNSRELFERFIPEVVPEKEQRTDAVPEMGGGVAVARLTRRTAILASVALVAGVLTDCAAQKQIPPLPQASGINPEYWAEMHELERQLLTTLENQIVSLNQICDQFFREYDGVDSVHRDVMELDRMFHEYMDKFIELTQQYEDVIDMYNAMNRARGEGIGPFFEIEMTRLANLFVPENEAKKHLQSIRRGFRNAFGRFVTETDHETLMEAERSSGVYVLLVNVDSIVGDDALHALSVYTARNTGNDNLRTAMLRLEDDERNSLNPEVKRWLEEGLAITNFNLPTYVVIVDGRPVCYFHHVKALDAAELDEIVNGAVERFKRLREHRKSAVNRGDPSL